MEVTKDTPKRISNVSSHCMNQNSSRNRDRESWLERRSPRSGNGVTPTQSTVNRLKESSLRIELSPSLPIPIPVLSFLPFDYCHPRDLSSIWARFVPAICYSQSFLLFLSFRTISRFCSIAWCWKERGRKNDCAQHWHKIDLRWKISSCWIDYDSQFFIKDWQSAMPKWKWLK